MATILKTETSTFLNVADKENKYIYMILVIVSYMSHYKKVSFSVQARFT